VLDCFAGTSEKVNLSNFLRTKEFSFATWTLFQFLKSMCPPRLCLGGGDISIDGSGVFPSK
jgi:hypothetical protein